MNLEIEAKYINIDPYEIRKRLKSLSFELVFGEFQMERATFIYEDRKMTMRVRKEYDQITMTYKYGESGKGALAMREMEVEVSDFDTTIKMLRESTKPIQILMQESRRELWRNGDTEVSIDEWPGTGKYIEIETSTEEELIKVSERLGLNYGEALFGRVGIVYEALGYDLGYINSIENLTFHNPPIK